MRLWGSISGSGDADDAAFAAFVAGSYHSLVRTGWLVTGDLTEAEDLAQGALTATWLHWRQVQTPEAYARTSLVRDAVRARRRTGREVVVPDLPELAGNDETAQADLAETLRRALALLPVEQRAVLVLRYWHDWTEAQIAAALGCSPGTVKSRASRAIAELRTRGLLPSTRPESAVPEGGTS